MRCGTRAIATRRAQRAVASSRVRRAPKRAHRTLGAVCLRYPTFRCAEGTRGTGGGRAGARAAAKFTRRTDVARALARLALKKAMAAICGRRGTRGAALPWRARANARRRAAHRANRTDRRRGAAGRAIFAPYTRSQLCGRAAVKAPWTLCVGGGATGARLAIRARRRRGGGRRAVIARRTERRGCGGAIGAVGTRHRTDLTHCGTAGAGKCPRAAVLT